MGKRPIVWVTALVLVAAPAAAQSNAHADRIRALRAESNAAIARHDLSGMVALLDDEFHTTSGKGGMLRSADAVVAALGQQFEQFDDLVYVRNMESIEVSTSGPRAAEIGNWVGTWTAAGGPVRTGGRYAAFWRERDSSWVIRSQLFVTLFCEGSGCS